MNNYLSDFPDVLATFDIEKNKDVKLELIKRNCNKKMWWKCTLGHEWQARVQDRTRGKGCPACSGRIATTSRNLEKDRPDLVKEWNYQKNEKLPIDYLSSSGKKVWWKCSQDHEWEATIDKRNQGRGCPYCAGRYATNCNNLQSVFPSISLEWHPTKNGHLKPFEVQPFSTKEVWWKCKKGHEYTASICKRTAGSKSCDECLSLQEKRPEIASEWCYSKNNNISPKDVFCHSGKCFYWQCQQFKDHIWKTSVCSRTGTKNSGCPFCRASKGEKAIKSILEDLKITYISQFKFENCKNKRALPFDFAIFPHNKKMGLIEFQGEQHYKVVPYWGGKNKLNEVKVRDQIKLEFCKEESIPLLILPYDENNLSDKIKEFVDYCL